MKCTFHFLYAAILSLSLTSCARAEKNQNDSSSGGVALETPPNDPQGTAPTPDPERTWKIALISDMNKSYGSKTYTSQLTAAIKHIQTSGVSLVLSTGDMVAGQKSGLDYDGMWSAFHKTVTIPLAQKNIPLLPSPGNHDASAGSAFRNERNRYRTSWNAFSIERFNNTKPQGDRVQFLPGVEQNYPLNYAITMGPAVFVALDATAVGPLINDQLGWLDEVLAKASNYPVKIVFGHMPLYPFAFNRAHEYIARGTASSGYFRNMEEMLERHKVTYFFSGHHHAFYPGQRNGSVRYVSVPLLGSGARKILTKNRSGSTSKEAFLYLTFNDKGEHALKALESPSLREIAFSSLPKAVTVPTSSASDCTNCATFPKTFFLNQTLRNLYNIISLPQ